jgi:hypothetical protein
MNRRNFLSKLAGIGLFSILPGAGRVWKAERKVIIWSDEQTLEYYKIAHRFDSPHFQFLPTFQDFMQKYGKETRSKVEIMRDEILELKKWPENLGNIYRRVKYDQS